MRAARWERGRIGFASEDEFTQHVEQFLSKGALLIAGPELPAPLAPFELAVVPPGGGAPVTLRGMIVSSSAEGSLVQILDFSDALVTKIRTSRVTQAQAAPAAPVGTSPIAAGRAALLGLATVPPSGPIAAPHEDPPNEFAASAPTGTSRRMTGVFPMAAPLPAGVLEGELANPTRLQDLGTLPLGPVAAVLTLAKISTVGLIRYLGARKATGKLTLIGPVQPVQKVWQLDAGAIMLTPAEREAARATFGWPSGAYRFDPGAPPEKSSTRVPTSAWRLVLDAIRGRLRESTPEELRAEIDLARAVTLRAAFLERSRALNLTPQEERLVKRDFDGRESLAQIVKLGGMSEVAMMRLVLLLQAMALVNLVAPQGEPVAAEDEVRAHYELLVSADLFAALGLHWTDAPEKLGPALADVRGRYGPGSLAEKTSPEFAARVVELAERAHRRLKDRAERRRYREELQLNVRHAAELLVAQVPIAKQRGEFKRAYELVSAACDLVDKPEWEKIRRELQTTAPTT